MPKAKKVDPIMGADDKPVNMALLAKTADAIERAAKGQTGVFGVSGPKGVGFNMAVWGSDARTDLPGHVDQCNTVACIAGTCHVILANKDRPPKSKAPLTIPSFSSSSCVVRDALNLTSDQATALFGGSGYKPGYRPKGTCGEVAPKAFSTRFSLVAIQPLHVVAVLRHYGETGDVDWSKGCEHTMDRSRT